MTSDGFEFHPPTERRVARRFEPPPWEQEQFEELARQRAEQERAEREALIAAAEIAAAVTGSPVPDQAVIVDDPPRPPQAATVPAEADAGEPPAPKPQLDPKRVDLLMLGLRAEEPDPLRSVWAVSLSAGVVLGLTGIAIGVWGAIALANGTLGSVGKLGGAIMVVFGLGFIGVGGWLIFRGLRQRGVL